VTSWQDRASALATDIAEPGSRWHHAVRSVPRHLLIPRWFTETSNGKAWEVRDGPADEPAWFDAAYNNRETLITRIGITHADDAEAGSGYNGWPTSSATHPSLVLDMYRRARIVDGAAVLDVGTGSGYGAALLASRFGDDHVTSIDVDPYLTATAAERLGSFGAHPTILTADAADELPGSYDRIVPMVSLPGVPASWLAALRPDGRLVFSLTGGSVLITARKTADGGALGRVEFERASFMAARHGPDMSLDRSIPDHALHGHGEQVTTSPYPVVDPAWGWELNAMLSVTNPGLAIRSCTDDRTGIATTWMAHGDGSWARATGSGNDPAVVHQSGPRRLWDILDDYRRWWLTHGYLPLRGAGARIEPDGTCHLGQDQWHATIPPAAHPA
jgi:protein-L-isoaspartate O-methyltransferase